MGETRLGKWIALTAAVALTGLLTACGGGGSGDDIARSGDDIIRAVTGASEKPVVELGVARELETITPPSSQGLAQEAERDPDIRELVCFSYDNFYDPTTGQLVFPSVESFSTSALQAFAPTGSRLYWQGKVSSFESLLQSANSQDLVDAVNAAGCV